MPIQLLLVPMPEVNTTPDNSGETLGNFVYWLRDFLIDLSHNTTEMTANTGLLFEQEQIEYFRAALDEVLNDGHFDRVHDLITAANIETIINHGIYGAQLHWKLFNIDFSFRRFIDQRTAALFEKLLSSIDTLLGSLLDAIPGGSALSELKDAVLDSVALVTE